MSDEIRPALTPKQWAQYFEALQRDAEGDVDLMSGVFDDAIGPTPDARAYCIAINNAALPDDDPRKLRREHVELLHEASRALAGQDAFWFDFVAIDRLAAVLDAYLPPEGA